MPPPHWKVAQQAASNLQICTARQVIADALLDHARALLGSSVQRTGLHIGHQHVYKCQHKQPLVSGSDMEQGRKPASVATALAASRRKGAAISFPADTILQLRGLLKACPSWSADLAVKYTPSTHVALSLVTIFDTL